MSEATSPIDNKHPLFGWNAKLFIDLNAANGDQLRYLTGDPENTENLISRRFERPGGLTKVGLIGTAQTWFSGGPGSRVELVIEGSNDGLESDDPLFDRNPNDHWETIASLSIDDLFDGSSIPQIRILGAAVSTLTFSGLDVLEGNPNIDIRRYRYVRVRAIVVFEDAPFDFTMDVELSGIAGDAQRFDKVDTLSQPLIPPAGIVDVTTEPRTRPAGVRYMTSQVVADHIVLDALSGYDVFLEGALEVGGPYFVMAFFEGGILAGALNVTGESLFFKQASGGGDLIDLDPFKFFRYRVRGRGGVPANGDLYTISFYTEFDGQDVLQKGNSQSDLQPDLARMLYRVVFGIPSQPGGPGTDVFITAEVQDITGNPIRDTSIPFYVAVSDDPHADGIVDPSATAIITGFGPVNVYFGIGTTRVLAKSGGAGTVLLTVSNGGAPGTIYMQAVAYAGFGGLSSRNLPGRLLISSEIATLTFA
jgi:hypothetical protein